MDPFNMPAFGAPVDFGANLSKDVAGVAPLANTWSGAQNGANAQFIDQTPTRAASGGVVGQTASFLGNLAGETGHLVAGAANWLKNFGQDMATSLPRVGAGVVHAFQDNSSINQINANMQQNKDSLNTLFAQYKSGKINATQYKAGLTSLADTTNTTDSQIQSLNNKINLDKANTTKAFIDLTSAVVTVMTVGTDALVGAAFKAADIAGVSAPALVKTATWLGSDAARPMLEPVSSFISKLSVDSNAFKVLDNVTQGALQRATAETVANAAPNMTGAQIARATATNIALKYPLTFWYLSSTAQSVYSELDNRKYGAATQQVAFNALLLLSGGPIGAALKWGGKAIVGVTDRTFGVKSVMDELSTYYGNKSPDGFAKALSDKVLAAPTKEAGQKILNDFSAAMAGALNATGSKDAVAAAYRIASGEQSRYLVGLDTVTHAQALDEMLNLANDMRAVDTYATAHGLPTSVVGVFQSPQKKILTDALTVSNDKVAQLKAWNDLKLANPNEAFANSSTFDRVITSAINRLPNSEELRQYINSIPANKLATGFPQELIDQLAKSGHVPIQPKYVVQPFKEGTGKVVSKFTNSEQNFFTKATQPLPVLSSLGSVMTKLGLSPNASSERLYQLFNENVAKNLAETNYGKNVSMFGDTAKQTSDDMLKKLADYSKGLKTPIGDYRLLSSKQIASALEISRADAREVMNAISAAHVQVPWAVRGLGPALVDKTFTIPGSNIARMYTKIQTRFRFTDNPFYRYLRLIPKTEILSQAEGGGFVRAMFTGKLGEIKQIQSAMRVNGMLEERGAGALSGEASDVLGTTEKNLTKKLLPAQEKSIAGLVSAQAERMGISWQDYITKYPQQVRDTTQMIAQYDRNANFLNSPLAKTLNIAFFPFRFDYKVAGIMAKSLGRQDLMTQVSIVNGLIKSNQWMQSPEGQSWYSQNSDAIKVFAYITPLASLNEVFQSLLPGHDHSLGNFGELGGLPFGWIPMITDQAGLTHFSQAGVDAKTGDTIPHYVPATDKGAAAIAIQDLLSMLFSYPGTQVGLPSKAGITRTVALSAVMGNKKTDLKLVTPTISPEAQNYQNTIKSLSNQSIGNNAPTPMQNFPSQNTGTTPVQSQPSPLENPLPNKTGGATKLKKSEFRPATIPGVR
jgi:hypothetical protein